MSYTDFHLVSERSTALFDVLQSNTYSRFAADCPYYKHYYHTPAPRYARSSFTEFPRGAMRNFMYIYVGGSLYFLSIVFTDR